MSRSLLILSCDRQLFVTRGFVRVHADDQLNGLRGYGVGRLLLYPRMDKHDNLGKEGIMALDCNFSAPMNSSAGKEMAKGKL